MFKVLLLVLLMSCGLNGEDGRNGINGLNGLDGRHGQDGGNYYSYEININIQQIVEEEIQEAYIDEGRYYQLPDSFNLNVDNSYPDCALQDLDIVIETDSEDIIYTFQATENRYIMEYKSGPLLKYLDTSYIKVYYRNKPEVDCGNAIYRLHSELQFSIRVFKEIDV